MLREPEEVSIKRKHTSETLHVLQQAFRVRSYNLSTHINIYRKPYTRNLYNRSGEVVRTKSPFGNLPGQKFLL